MGKHFGDNDSSRISVHELFSRSVEDKKNNLKNDSAATAEDTDSITPSEKNKESTERTVQPNTSHNDTPSSGDIVIEYTDGNYHTDTSFADKFSQDNAVDTHADSERTVPPRVDTNGNEDITDTARNVDISGKNNKVAPGNNTDNVQDSATVERKDNSTFDYKTPTDSASSNVTIEFYSDNAPHKDGRKESGSVDLVDTVDNADTEKTEEKRAVEHTEATPHETTVPTPFPDRKETYSEEKSRNPKIQPQPTVVEKIEEPAVEDDTTPRVDKTKHILQKTEETNTLPHKDSSYSQSQQPQPTVDTHNTTDKVDTVETDTGNADKNSVAQELPVDSKSDSVEEQLDKVSEPKPAFPAPPRGDNAHTVGTGDTVGGTEKEYGDSEGSDEGKSESSTSPSTFNTSPNAIPTPIPNVPNFKKRVLAKKKDTSAETEFENVKPDETKMTKDSRIIDQANRNKKIKYALIFLVSIVAVALVGWLLYDNFSNSVNHSENMPQEQQEQDNTDYDSEHNFMYQMAEDKDPKFLDKIDQHPKENKVENNAISNDVTGTKITFGSRYILTNDNVCVVSAETDFCYLTELAENNDGEPGDNVATAYSFANIFTTQFFKDYSHIEKVNIPGADYAAHGNVTIASKEKPALFIAHDNGLGYMFVFNDSSQMNEFVSTMGISPK